MMSTDGTAKYLNVLEEGILNKIRVLAEERRRILEIRKAILANNPQNPDLDEYDEKARDLEDEIEQLIQAGKLLGLIGEEVNYKDYL